MEADCGRSCGGDGGDGDGVRPKEDAAADGELSEDEKMEKFYALIRNYKEARDRHRIEQERLSAEEECGDGGEEDGAKGTRKKKKVKVGDREQPSWIPAFKWEDFTEKAQVEFRRHPVVFTASNFNDNDRNSNMHGDVKDPPPVPGEVDGGGLDLKLRL